MKSENKDKSEVMKKTIVIVIGIAIAVVGMLIAFNG